MKRGMYKKAIVPYLMTVESDNSCLNSLGYCYDRLGQLDKAMKFFKEAINHGDIFAIDNIGLIYQNVIQNNYVALKLYQKAIELGNLFAIEHYLTINNNIDQIIKFIQKGISKGTRYSFITLNNFKRERNNTYLYDNQLLLYYIKKCINNEEKFAYKPLPHNKCENVSKFRNQIMNMDNGICIQCFDKTKCITICNNIRHCPHCHIQFLYSKKHKFT